MSFLLLILNRGLAVLASNHKGCSQQIILVCFCSYTGLGPRNVFAQGLYGLTYSTGLFWLLKGPASAKFSSTVAVENRQYLHLICCRLPVAASCD